MNLPDHQSVCTRPFEWFEVHPDGSVFICCPAWLKRPIGNLLQQSIEEIWNGSVAQEIRKTIFNGSFHNCSKTRCPHLLNQTAPVGLLKAVAAAEIKAALLNRTSQLSFLPQKLNLCFDHSCNLACPSCRQKIQNAQGTELQKAQRISDILCNELLPEAHAVTLSGFGDPFGSPTYLALLKQLNQHDFPNLQHVRLHTNGQLLTQQMWQSLPNLHPLISEIEISVDAASDQTYRLNRPGGSFSRLLDNLDFLSRQNCKLTLSMVVQQNNWQELTEFYRLGSTFNAKIYLSQLVNWGTFDKNEYLRRAIHLPNHPEHQLLLKQLAKLRHLNIDFGNLLPFVSD